MGDDSGSVVPFIVGGAEVFNPVVRDPVRRAATPK
jgi:hypothetical protein